MKFAFKFSNILGAVYRRGDLVFTSDGNTLICAVENKISIYDLKNNKASTLPIASRFNYIALDLSPSGSLLLAVNEEGEANIISLYSQTIIHVYHFKRKVKAVKFSPDGKYFAACKENNVFVFRTPDPLFGGHNAIVMERVFTGAYDETTCLDWSSDSRILAVGSKDMSTKLYPIEKWQNFRIYSLGNHTDTIVKCFFEENSYDIITISRNGQVCVWECTLEPDQLILRTEEPFKKLRLSNDSEEEDDIDPKLAPELSQSDLTKELAELNVDEIDKQTVDKLFYKRIARHYIGDEVRKDNKDAIITSAAYHRRTKILVTGYSIGVFFIHEMPEVNVIHSLSISDQKISSIAMNQTGDWIALGCSDIGQLLVWEWQSETYVMKQQGHANNMTCVSYSADGELLATGGEDGKVKLWNVVSGFCFVTFSEHSNAISAVLFSRNKNIVVSASLDGTVRAYDINRYRNFRTFTGTRSVQFSSVAIDSSGEFVAAGGQDVFEIFLWSVKTGRLLEVLAGHEGPVSSLVFSPDISSTTLASVSWDKTLRIWEAIEKGSAHETIELTADGLCVAFKPNGLEVAVATLDGQMVTFDIKTAQQTASIEGRDDLGSGRTDTDLITAKKSLQAKSFTSLCYSADAEYLLAGGNSKNVCIYNIEKSLLLKKFEITQNRSLDAVDDFINRRKLTEFGNLALVEEREENEGGSTSIKLPGVKKGDMSSRSLKPEVRVLSLQFSPTGEQWAAATTEGLLIYSLSFDMSFDPFDLQLVITPEAIKKAIKEQDHVNALIMALKLNEADLLQESVETIPVKDVELVVSGLDQKYLKRLLMFVSSNLDNSVHLEYYLHWASTLLTLHGQKMKGPKHMPALLALEKSVVRKYQQLSKLCDYNTYTLQYISTVAEMHEKKSKTADVENLDMENDEVEQEPQDNTTDDEYMLSD